ncbi:hypothetical protein BHE74_00057314 [Ensete ventricosum]|uniref:Uncharacterized protein n=1 Tax=Ensete ventricosum TaxID=4639 RepID=A0A444CVN6_ENSVE|nr:hypothetical protein GW17_00047981 [Ensete ventricosum]RWW37557.1 hypothetical protein BHE74_00057314 [Ensete ventricosum]RZR74103.1 hypothetical protein BHM03_00032178 [Ensete ventricosum]
MVAPESYSGSRSQKHRRRPELYESPEILEATLPPWLPHASLGICPRLLRMRSPLRNHVHPETPEPDTLSSDSIDSLRAQLRQVNRRLDEEIQDKSIMYNFCLPTLEAYDSNSEHVAAFRAQMALYDTSDALICQAFLTTLRGLARMWYSQLRPSSDSSFDQLSKEFGLNILASARHKPTATSLLELSQNDDEPLVKFVVHFAAEIRCMCLEAPFVFGTLQDESASSK